MDHLESSVEFDSTVGYSRVFFEASCQIVRTRGREAAQGEPGSGRAEGVIDQTPPSTRIQEAACGNHLQFLGAATE